MQKTKMTDESATTMITTLNETGLNEPIKRQRLSDRTKARQPCAVYRMHAVVLQDACFHSIGCTRLKIQRIESKRIGKLHYTNNTHKRAVITVVLSDILDFNKKVTRDKEGQ